MNVSEFVQTHASDKAALLDELAKLSVATDADSLLAEFVDELNRRQIDLRSGTDGK